MSTKVHIEPSGHQFTVEPEETILDAAIRQGVALQYGCRSGACGACKGKVTSGEIDYRDRDPSALNEQEQSVGMALFCIAHPVGDISIEAREIAEAKEIPVRKLPTKVAAIEPLPEDVVVMRLTPPEDERLQFLAGQYVHFILKDGRKRSFSIANPPHDDRQLEFHIRRIKGGRFTESEMANLKEKDIVRIEGPFGSFFLREDSERPIIMLATGTGFGPIQSMVEHAIAEGIRRPIYIYWGARTRDGLYRHDLGRKWDDEHDNIHYRPVLSRPGDDWDGRTGHVQQAVMADFEDLSGFEVYACGHPEMVMDAKRLCTERGLDPDHCYSDAFEWAQD